MIEMRSYSIQREKVFNVKLLLKNEALRKPEKHLGTLSVVKKVRVWTKFSCSFYCSSSLKPLSYCTHHTCCEMTCVVAALCCMREQL